MNSFLNKPRTDGLLMAIIFSIAALLRFWQFGSIPFMHDEFSALFRTQYPTFHQLIRNGVVTDSHPAGVQVFLFYWTKLFGTTEWVVKLPFTLLGVGSVLLVYLVGKQWFGRTTGLLTATFMAVTQYFIFYSQLARPYSPGLFFTLLSVYYWTKIIFNKSIKKNHMVLFVVASATNTYIHAFTLFFFLVQSITGFFFIDKTRLKVYFWSLVAVGLLYIPHLPIFLTQLKRGDIGGWLAAPTPSFIVHFGEYLFQFSTGFFLLNAGIIAYLSIRFYNNGKEKHRFRIIALIWFLVSYFIAYFYSIWRTPVIQYSTLYFVTPFLLLFIFSFIGEINAKVTGAAVLFLIIYGSGVLIFKRAHYKEMYRQGFDQIPYYTLKNLTKYPKEQTAVVLQAPNTRMFDYYFNKLGSKPQYFSFSNNITFDSLCRWLQKVQPDHIIYGGADYPPLYVIESLKDIFPYILEQHAFFNSEFYFLSKEKEGPKTVDAERCNRIKKDFTKNGKPLVLKPKQQFSPALTIDMDTLTLNRRTVLNAVITITDTTAIKKSLLVFDMRQPDGKAFFWSGTPVQRYAIQTGTQRYTVHIAKRIQSLGTIPPKIVLKIYLWKKDSVPLHLNELKFYTTQTNPVENGLWGPL